MSAPNLNLNDELRAGLLDLETALLHVRDKPNFDCGFKNALARDLQKLAELSAHLCAQRSSNPSR